MRKKHDSLSEAIGIEIVVVTDGDIHVDVVSDGAIAIVVGLATPCCIEGHEVDEIGDQCHRKAY